MVYLENHKSSASDHTSYFNLGFKESNDVKQENLKLSWAHIFFVSSRVFLYLRFAKLRVLK